jgi:DNA-binding transcriptional LysR family regulator
VVCRANYRADWENAKLQAGNHPRSDAMDRLGAMKVFVVAVDAGSFAAAGRELRRSPSAISRAIALLEDHVGAELFQRTTRSMRLTAAGERYAVACRRILTELEEAELFVSDARAAPQGVLTISAPPIAGEAVLQPIVDAFLAAHPGVSAHMQLVDRHVNLVDEGVDVAVRVGDLPDSSMVAVKVGGEIRRVVAAAPAYLAQRPPIAAPGDLADHDIVAIVNFGTDRWLFPPAPGSGATRVVTFTPRILVNTVRAAVASAVAGMGVVRLYSYHVAEEVRERRLQIVLADAEYPPQPVHLLVQPSRMPAPKVRAFLDFAAPRLRAEFGRLAAEARRLPMG